MKEPTWDYSRYFWQGEKVRLRPPQIKDAERNFAGSLDSPSRQILQLGIELPTSVKLQRATMEKWNGCQVNDGLYVFMIENLAGEHVGGISMHSIDEKNGLFSFGIIVYREHQKHGYATDAVRILLRYGFWERRFQKCNSACAHTNEASIQLHKKLGFIKEGRRRRQVFYNGQYYDDILFGMTREEFDAQERR